MKISKKEILNALKRYEEVIAKCDFTYYKDMPPAYINSMCVNMSNISYLGGLLTGLREALELDEDIISGRE